MNIEFLDHLIPLTHELTPAGGAAAHIDESRERAARAVWLTVTEPGDGIAGTLLMEYGAVESLAWALQTAPESVDGEVRKALERWRPRFDAQRVEHLLKAAVNLGATLCIPGDTAWANALQDLGPHAPIGLWLRGRSELLTHRGAAVVGARAATPYGCDIAQDFAFELAARGLATISGGAYGIDAAAHRAALAGEGPTIAVMAGGCDRLYPSGNRDLLEQILAEGLLVSELPPGQAPTRWRFLQRNRVVAALASATVVVEAGARSGALNTANHASTLGRPLGAVPGSVRSASSVGCHRLIRENNATLITCADELVELLGEWGNGKSGCGNEARPEEAPEVTSSGGAPTAKLTLLGDAEARRVLDALPRRGATTVDEIACRAGLSVASVNGTLIGLELDGLAEHTADGWRLTRKRARAS